MCIYVYVVSSRDMNITTFPSPPLTPTRTHTHHGMRVCVHHSTPVQVAFSHFLFSLIISVLTVYLDSRTHTHTHTYTHTHTHTSLHQLPKEELSVWIGVLSGSGGVVGGGGFRRSLDTDRPVG